MPDRPTIVLLGHETTLQEALAPMRVRALLGEAALRGVQLVFARSVDCDLVAERIRGSEFVRGEWTSVDIAVPPLVVSAAPTIRPEYRAVEDWLRQRTRLLAFDSFDKHEMTALLAADPALRPHLIPEEVVVAEGLEAQLARWLAGGSVVVKRADGALGTGLFFLLREGDDVVVHKDAQSWRGTEAEAIARVAAAIRGRLSYRTFLVQRFIDTRDTVGQPATLRVDMARRPDGGWSFYRVTGRIAIGSKLVSNRAKGSAMVDVESFLSARGAEDVAAKVREMEALASAIANGLCRTPGLGDCYEFGMDIAVDQDLHFWFIEANKRPLSVAAELERLMEVMPYWLSLIAR
ncbi:YheC/YheD family protein [Ancylobacter sp. IITR112]|uniref:YheC/YheD family protein n=1 Tax=Ancylobacter sp. IITR112 TaxID=3138073 RepID=UPI00352B32F6